MNHFSVAHVIKSACTRGLPVSPCENKLFCWPYLVATDTSCLEGLGGQLLVLIGHEVDAQGELVDAGLLAAQVEDPDLGIGHTTAEPGLGVRLVLAVPVATRGTTPHLDTSLWK